MVGLAWPLGRWEHVDLSSGGSSSGGLSTTATASAKTWDLKLTYLEINNWVSKGKGKGLLSAS
ncbi:hypothetical protein EJB05_15670, partial [Eragrostis curvula]